MEEFLDMYFYRQFSTYSGDKITGYDAREYSVVINYERDGEPKELVVTAIDLILYVAKYGKI
ncbi:hypothetical protein JGK44_001141 [Shewanella algae]|nr:hypothetical protein [Shewanella algae]